VPPDVSAELAARIGASILRDLQTSR
jgi:hypothetical protein